MCKHDEAIQMTLAERILPDETRIPLKFAMRHLAGAVSVVTAGIGDERTGATITTAHSLSVEPEVMVVSINLSSSTWSHQPASALLRECATRRPDRGCRPFCRPRRPQGAGSLRGCTLVHPCKRRIGARRCACRGRLHRRGYHSSPQPCANTRQRPACGERRARSGTDLSSRRLWIVVSGLIRVVF